MCDGETSPFNIYIDVGPTWDQTFTPSEPSGGSAQAQMRRALLCAFAVRSCFEALMRLDLLCAVGTTLASYKWFYAPLTVVLLNRTILI